MRDVLADASDATLVVAIARYRQEALAEAYRRHAGAVFGLARRLLSQRALAEEVVQEVFLRLWNNPDRFDPSRGHPAQLPAGPDPRPSASTCSAPRAPAARREEREARSTAEAGYDLEHEVWDLATADQVRRALDALPDNERAAIQLAYFGGHTYREVAEQLHEPEGTIKSRIRAGLKRLRHELAAVGITVGDE